MPLRTFAIAVALMSLAAIPALAQSYGIAPVPRTRPFPSRSSGMFARGGYFGPRPDTNFSTYGYGHGYGYDYSGDYYRPTSNLGYYYLGYYYPPYSGDTLRTPLSAPAASFAVPIPNLTSVSPQSPSYTYPDLINPSANPTIRRGR